jgi:hypothetical protein
MEKIIIDKENGKVILNFDTRFYPLKKIILAAQCFTDSCWVFVDGDAKDTIMATLKPKSKDIDISTIGYEFYNYVLGLMKVEG